MIQKRIHLHVENSRDVNEVFDISARRVNEALARHPRVAEQLQVSIGYGGDILDAELSTADALFCWDFDRRDLARRAPRLRWVHTHGAGVSHMMPLDWLPAGAVLTNSRGVHGQRATEYAFMAILMLNNRVPEMIANQQQARWQEVFSTGVEGKTLLIVGVGHIGSGVAAWAKRAGMRVLGIRRTARPRRNVDQMYAPRDLHALLPRADFVLVSAPHTEASRGMLGAHELAMLKAGAGLVNYSRAGLVDYDALRAKLVAGEMSAVLDVFDPEPLPEESPLWHTPNVIITPHCSSDDREQYTPRTLDLVMANMQRLIDGRPLRNRVSRKHQY